MQQDSNHAAKFILKFFQGMLIGLGAVLPGISGGVLCVVFGIYKTIMEFLADPFHTYKTHLPGLMPVIIGGAAGFLGIANILSFFLEKYPAPQACCRHFFGRPEKKEEQVHLIFPCVWQCLSCLYC